MTEADTDRERETETETDRQTDRDRQTDGGRETGRGERKTVCVREPSGPDRNKCKRVNPLHACLDCLHCTRDRLVGLVVKASASRAEGPGFESRLRRDFSGSSHTSDLNIGTPVATLQGAWRYRVSAGTGWPGVSIL